MSTPNIDDVAQTLAEYERLAISTGATVQILPTKFSADGETWVKFWVAAEPPALARAGVLRDGTLTERYVVWAESLPAEESWRALWLAKPTKLFGAYADRSALRRAFRDAIGDRREPDEQNGPLAPVDPALDWDAEIVAAVTVEALHELHARMKRARAVTVAREAALQDQLAIVQRTTPADAWAAADEPSAPEPTPDARPATSDYLPPQNRAARRKAARKKGARR